jgi:nucleotide-binding universal stress UspA family protein
MELVRILLPITRRGTTGACAAAAFGLAQRFGAEVEVLHSCPTPAERLPYATELSPLYFEELLDVGKKQSALERREAKKWFTKASRGFPKARANLLSVEGLAGPVISMRAKVSDLAVLPAANPEEQSFWPLARDAALFHSGRPVLVMPEATHEKFGVTVVVAWKDAVEAVRAVAAAKPFLAAAQQVKLVTVVEHGADESAPAMADYLRRSGLRVELVKLEPQSGGVGEALLAFASSESALLVMGAYGRWRWREWVFGGATQYILGHTTAPVLMVH